MRRLGFEGGRAGTMMRDDGKVWPASGSPVWGKKHPF